MVGTVGILNVGNGDTKLIFDKSNPAECIRAARIVKDMLRRGYALLVEIVQADGAKTYQRVKEFDDNTCEYIIADLDPFVARQADAKDADEQVVEPPEDAPAAPSLKIRPAKGKQTKRIHAADTRTVAVSRSAGG